MDGVTTVASVQVVQQALHYGSWGDAGGCGDALCSWSVPWACCLVVHRQCGCIVRHGEREFQAVDADRAAAVVALMSAVLETRVWLEYVESDSKWSDGLSRKLDRDAWAKQSGFALRQVLWQIGHGQ